MKTIILLLCGMLALTHCHAGPTWQEALRTMPLPADTPLLNRDNAVSVLLRAFHSNDVVKALLVLPEVSDDFYLINRDQPKLNLRATNLLDALIRLTNATALRITFRDPFLMAHLANDRLDPSLVVENAGTARLLKAERALAHGLFADTHWERLQPRLATELRRRILPDADSQSAWHFARHNFAAWNLTGWELLTAVSLTGNTTVTVQQRDIGFRARTGG